MQVEHIMNTGSGRATLPPVRLVDRFFSPEALPGWSGRAAVSAQAIEQFMILRSRSGVLTKRIGCSANGWQIEPFSAGRWFTALPKGVNSLDELAELLGRISSDRYACVVRGAL